MIELLLEPLIELIALVVRAIILVFVWLPFGAVAGIMARNISPAAFTWQATARVGSVLLTAEWAGLAVPTGCVDNWPNTPFLNHPAPP